MAKPITPEWVDENHPFNTGRLLMTLMMAGIEASPVVTEEGDYTPYIDVVLDQGGKTRRMRLHVTGERLEDEAQ